MTLDNKVPQRIHQLHQILSTQKLIAEKPLNLSPEIVHEHVGLAGFLTPGKHSRSEDGGHPPRRCREVPPGPVDQNNVPIDLVNVVRQVVNGELAFGEQKILDGPAICVGLGLGLGQKLLVFTDFSSELHVVGFDAGVRRLEFGDDVFVLVEEDGARAVVIECGPEEGLVGEAEDEEVGARIAEERGGDGVDLGVGHGFEGGVGGGGGVVKEGFGDGGGERGGGGGGGGGG